MEKRLQVRLTSEAFARGMFPPDFEKIAGKKPDALNVFWVGRPPLS